MPGLGLVPESPLKLFADEATRILTTRTIRSLQALRETHLHAGADSGLRDTWDEICVQVQEEYSPLWEAYAETIRAFLRWHCERMPARDLHSIWRRTDAGYDWQHGMGDWECGEAEARKRLDNQEWLYTLDDVVEDLLERLLWKAADWSNRRIRRYIDRC